MVPESSSLYQIEAQIRTALDAPLPGGDAHRELAPQPRRGWRAGHVPATAQPAAGLILLYLRGNAPHLLLTVRSGVLPRHGGQVALPGGRVEPGESIPAAALREAQEEAGVEPARVRLLGRLTPLHVAVSDFALHPVVGVAASHPAFRRRSGEVRRLLEVPLASLLPPGRAPRRGYLCRRPAPVRAPYFDACGERLWGATAMIVAELLTMLGAAPVDPWRPGPRRPARQAAPPTAVRAEAPG